MGSTDDIDKCYFGQLFFVGERTNKNGEIPTHNTEMQSNEKGKHRTRSKSKYFYSTQMGTPLRS